jgi:1,2-phenylacetyl-CoA epoxidase catalytic subunit
MRKTAESSEPFASDEPNYTWRDASVPGALTDEAALMSWREILDCSRGDRVPTWAIE